MRIAIQSHLFYTTPHSCDVLLQVEAARDATQNCLQNTLIFANDTPQHEITGEDNIGTRRWVESVAVFDCTYLATVDVTRDVALLETLGATRVSRLPNAVTKHLMPSRYCLPEPFIDFVPAQFGSLQGGPLINAMSKWILDSFTYDIAASDSGTTAAESFAKRAGVCRDYAHVLISMARAVGIPARFVSAYAPDVTPQDFHAVVEVFLDGDWHLVDPTGMAQPHEIVRIGVGRDAADASFMTSYGIMEMKKQSVEVRRIG